MIRGFTELLLEIQLLSFIYLGRIHGETVLHSVATKPLGYFNFLTSSTELKKKVSAWKLENNRKVCYKGNSHFLSAKCVLS